MSDEPTVDDIRDRLRSVMVTGGFTQTDVAKSVGLSQSVISRFLSGESSPPHDTLNRLRAFLGDEQHEDVLSHEDVRRAVRLYRFVRGVLDGGTQLVIREKDGTEKVIIPLW